MRAEACVADDRGKKMTTRHKWSPKQRVVSIFRRVVSIFHRRPSRQVEAFKQCSDEDLVRLYGKNSYRPQPEGYTVDDLMERADKIRETGLPIAD